MYVTTGSADYDKGPYNVTFPAGATHVSFNISFSKKTRFQLIIVKRLLPHYVTRGVPSKTKVIVK